MDFPTSTTMMPTSTKGVSGFWSLSSGGEFPDEPDLHKQGRLQDHAEWHHNLPGRQNPHDVFILLFVIVNTMRSIKGKKEPNYLKYCIKWFQLMFLNLCNSHCNWSYLRRTAFYHFIKYSQRGIGQCQRIPIWIQKAPKSKCNIGSGKLSQKKAVKKGTLSTGVGVIPSSLIKPKFTRISNHSEMDFWTPQYEC